jgi:molybdopterin molybdotransferase
MPPSDTQGTGAAPAPLMAVDAAVARVVARATRLAAERVPVEAAGARVLAKDVAAKLTQPPFDNSAMDGYAVHAADVATVPVTLKVIGQSAAGHPFKGRVEPGEAARIFTGAPMPDGADTVVIQENTQRGDGTVTVLQAEPPGKNVRLRGHDFREGEVKLKAGLCLRPRDLMLAAAMNVAELEVVTKPRVAILATGDELVPVGATPGLGQIISSVPAGLASMVRRAGAEPLFLGIAEDRLASLDSFIEQAKNRSANVLVTIGGASAGDHDLVRQALLDQGCTLDVYKIAMRPGKPLMFGRLGSLLVLGLPGNPAAALIAARIFLYPLLWRLLGRQDGALTPRQAVLSAPIGANADRAHYMRARIVSDAPLTVEAARSQDSSLMSVLAEADCLIVRQPHAPAAQKGDAVEVLPLDF